MSIYSEKWIKSSQFHWEAWRYMLWLCSRSPSPPPEPQHRTRLPWSCPCQGDWSAVLSKWLAFQSGSCTGIPDCWQLNNMWNASYRKVGKYNFLANLLWHASIEEGWNKCWTSEPTQHLSQEGQISLRFPIYQIECHVKRITCTWQSTFMPNSKCFLFLLSLRTWTESNFPKCIQFHELVWDFLFLLNNSWSSVGSSLMKLL